MARKPGVRNRNYPGVSLKDALEIPSAIQDGASGRPISKLALSKILDVSPSNSDFRALLLASRFYGLTNGGVNADQFELTALGNEATGTDLAIRQTALMKAVMNIEPFRLFLTTYNGKKVPQPAAFKEFLVGSAGVPAEWADECMERVLADARFAGLIDQHRTGEYVDLSREQGDSFNGSEPSSDFVDDDNHDELPECAPVSRAAVSSTVSVSDPIAAAQPKKVFIAHGKNKGPLEELKKILNQFKVPHAVAVDEPHAGRPISAKVAEMMRNECSSAIFIFTADERFLREEPDGTTTEIWRPSENVVYELGAAAVLYDRRIVVFKEKRVTFPSDYRDLGYIEFETDQIREKTANLFAELVALDILEVRAKG